MSHRTESNSSINTYKTCPAKYAYHYGPKKRFFKATEAMQLGNLVHEGLAHSLKGNATVKEALDYIGTCLDYAEVQEKAKDVVAYYAPLIGLGGWSQPGSAYPSAIKAYDNRYIEYKFNVDLFGVQVLGYIDAIIQDRSGNVVLVDWKTRGQLLDTSQVEMDSQLYVYAYVAKHILGIPINRVCQVQMKTTLPALPKTVKSGALSKVLGATTRSVFIDHCILLGLAGQVDTEAYADKFVDESEFLRMSYIDIERVLLKTNEFIGWVKRIQDDSQMLPVNNSSVCKWCQYQDLCIDNK